MIYRALRRKVPNAQVAAQIGARLGLLQETAPRALAWKWLDESVEGASNLEYDDFLAAICAGGNSDTQLALVTFRNSQIERLNLAVAAGGVAPIFLETYANAAHGIRFNPCIGTFHATRGRDDQVTTINTARLPTGRLAQTMKAPVLSAVCRQAAERLLAAQQEHLPALEKISTINSRFPISPKLYVCTALTPVRLLAAQLLVPDCSPPAGGVPTGSVKPGGSKSSCGPCADAR